MGGTFRFSRNITGLWPVQECRRAWAAQEKAILYDELTALAAAGRPAALAGGPGPPISSSRAIYPPGCRPTAGAPASPCPRRVGQVVRCALEGLALKYRWVFEQLERILGKRLEPIHIVGGGSSNRLLYQFAADATGRRVVAGPVEATAIGNLLVQAMALGEIGWPEEAREVVRRSFEVHTFEPDPRQAAAWDDAYGRLTS